LLLLNPPHVLVDQREARLAFVVRWQQFTGPIVAKGFEDTALYVYHPLLSLNEVGGDPRPSDATSREDFYTFLQERRQHWPGTLDATSTHDTKRSEDVRARLNVLSEIPEEWRDRLNRWSQLNAKHRKHSNGHSAPDKNEEYFLYQTLLGVWPLDAERQSTLLQRVQDHLIKATREAMVHTRWTRPNQIHEEELQTFTARVLASSNREFLEDFGALQKKVAYFGMITGLSQTLLKIAAPGVADFYQGSELWDLRLVDPDNRGPIDFEKRSTMLQGIVGLHSAGQQQALRDFPDHWEDGRVKLYLIWKALGFRRAEYDLFLEGEFIPLQSAGCHAQHVIAFLRRTSASCALVAIPRWLSQIPRKDNETFDWCDTRVLLPPQSPSNWKSVLREDKFASGQGDGASLFIRDLLRDFPVALLTAGD
jgi:(1->4)-alpha-D-glucan 1-alpha-D-glucosylmutase